MKVLHGLALGLALAGALGLSALAADTASAADDAEAFADTSRIAAIGGSVTEIVFALGEESHLVARDATSLYPEAALKLPDLGYMRQLSPEGVLSVNPTGILALQGSGPPQAIQVLKTASVPYIEVPESFDREGVLARIRVIGKALGVEAKAETLAAEVDAKLKAAEGRTAGMAERKRVLFALSLAGGRVLASGSGTAADGMIRLAGGVNAVEGYQGYKQLSDEAIVSARPDVVLVVDHAGPGIFDSDLLAHPAIAQTPAGAARRLVRMDGSYLLGFGPRTADAVNDLAAALYGDQASR
ncbi:heme/hemin ABC transporter substrate-binding protein [Mycoplana dimorpha]|uniref:Iron complex transport system substrate-binding protein n=1 Tax=Mycoplana dimorpha TaxID=28320 RepID=A0A2T5B3L0_MYCDI|nr:ABC transporter substrate-binding protein [Mycoplana dimorpha]PTM93524.1 iron complex transport system substrate-binding protein [Mycoplana dimorpha]